MHLYTRSARSEGRYELAFDPERLRRLRIKRRITQRQIADLLGIFPQNYGTYEHGRSVPREPRLVQIAEILETTTDYLMGRTDDPAPKITTEDLTGEELELLRAFRSGDLQTLNRLFLDKARKGQRK